MLLAKFMKDLIFRNRKGKEMMGSWMNWFKLEKEGWLYQIEFNRFWEIKLIYFISGKYR